MPIPDCQDCQQLWHAYAQATTRHIELTGKQRIAQLRREQEIIQQLEPEVVAAEQARNDARESIRRHELDVHGGEQLGVDQSA